MEPPVCINPSKRIKLDVTNAVVKVENDVQSSVSTVEDDSKTTLVENNNLVIEETVQSEISDNKVETIEEKTTEIKIKAPINRMDGCYYTTLNSITYRVSNSDTSSWDDVQNKWDILRTNFHKLRDGMIVVWRHFIVAIGSLLPFQSPEKYKNTVIFFNTSTHTVEPILDSAHLTRPISDFSATVWKDKIYIFGGRLLNGFFYLETNDVHCFNCRTATWSRCMNLPQSRTGISFPLKKYIYFVSSVYSRSREVFRFTPKKNYWRIVSKDEKKAEIIAKIPR